MQAPLSSDDRGLLSCGGSCWYLARLSRYRRAAADADRQRDRQSMCDASLIDDIVPFLCSFIARHVFPLPKNAEPSILLIRLLHVALCLAKRGRGKALLLMNSGRTWNAAAASEESSGQKSATSSATPTGASANVVTDSRYGGGKSLIGILLPLLTSSSARISSYAFAILFCLFEVWPYVKIDRSIDRMAMNTHIPCLLPVVDCSRSDSAAIPANGRRCSAARSTSTGRMIAICA